MVTAMEHMQMEPVIIEDLVKYGEDRGFDRGFDRGAAHERVRMYDDMFEVRLGRPLTPSEHDMLSRSITAVTA